MHVPHGHGQILETTGVFEVQSYIHSYLELGLRIQESKSLYRKALSGNHLIFKYIYTTTQCKLFERKWSMCTSGWKEKDHQRKLQWVAPPPVQGVFAPMAEGKTPPVQVAGSDHHHVCKWSTCAGWLKDTTTSARCKGQDRIYSISKKGPLVYTCTCTHTHAHTHAHTHTHTPHTHQVPSL